MPISLFDLSVNVLESIIFIVFLTNYFRMRPTFHKLNFALWVLFATIGVSFINIYIGYEKYFIFLMALVVYFPWLVIFAQGNIVEKGYISIFMMQLNSIIVTVTLVLSSLLIYGEVEIARVLKEHYVLLVIVVKIVFVFITMIIAQERKKLASSLSLSVLMGFAVFSIASFLIHLSLEDILYLNSVNLVDVAIALVGLLLLVVSVFIVFFKIQGTNQRNLENELKIQSLDYQSDLNEVALEVNRETSQIQHDLKHLLSHVDFLLSNGQIKKAQETVRQYYQNVETEKKVILTPSEVINYILNTKNNLAREKGLAMRFVINFWREPHISDVDLVILLGNAIDNAIENCEGESIEVRIEDKNEYLHIIVSNSIAQSVLAHNEQLATTKKQKGHGYGIGSIKEVAYRNGGTVDFYEKNNRFFCSILIK